MKPLELGQKVTITHKFRRQRFRCGGERHREWVHVELENPVDGVYVGDRTLSDGYVKDVCVGQHCTIFIPLSNFKVRLVCTSRNTNPFYAIIEEDNE